MVILEMTSIEEINNVAFGTLLLYWKYRIMDKNELSVIIIMNLCILVP